MAQKQPGRTYRWFEERIDLPVILGWLLSATGLLYGGLDRRLDVREALQHAARLARGALAALALPRRPGCLQPAALAVEAGAGPHADPPGSGGQGERARCAA